MKTKLIFIFTCLSLITALLAGCDNLSFNPPLAEEIENDTTGEVRFIASNATPADVTYKLPLGTSYTSLPTPSLNNGYIFKGWYTESGGNGTQYTSLYITNSNQILYAYVTLKTLNIMYELDSGTNNASNPDTYTIDQNITLYNPTRGSDTFLGWYESSTNFKTSSKRITGWTSGSKSDDVTVYARWPDTSATLYTISYNLNGGTNDSRNWGYFENDENVTLYEPTCTGLEFGGWYPASDFSGTLVNGWSAGEKSSDVSLYALWAYEINYYDYGGATFSGTGKDTSGNDLPTFYAKDVGIATLPTPAKANVSFAGWYTDAACTNAITQIASSSTGAIDLYAKWITEGSVTILIPKINQEIDLYIDSTTATPTDIASGVTVTATIKNTTTNTSLVGDSDLTSTTITLYQGGVATTCTSTTDGSTAPAITLPTWLPADTYQIYIEIVFDGTTYSGYINFTVTE